MNVLQRQMFQQGGPTSPRDIIIAERQKRGLPIRDGIMLNPELINQVRQLQAGQSIAEIFSDTPLPKYYTSEGTPKYSDPPPDITIQEQPQQAPSEMLNIGPVLESAVPSVDPRKLIEYYLSIGLNPADILEKFPAATTQMIEEVAQQKGGVINPGVRGPETFEGGPENIFIDETVLVEGRQPRQKPPIDPIREELISLDIPKLTPTIETGLPDSDLNNLESAVVEGQVTRQTNLGPNEYKASDGTIYQIDPAKFEQSLSSENSRILGGILMNPNVEYGSNLASIIENTARARSSTLVPEESIGVGQDIQALNLSDAIQSGTKAAVDFSKEGIESLFNIIRFPFVNPELRGIFGSRAAEEAARQSGVGERVNLFDTRLDQLDFSDPQSVNDYFRTAGEKPELLDQIITQSAVSEVTPTTETDTQKEIEELQKTPAPADTEVVTAEKETTAEGTAETEAETTDAGTDVVGTAGEKTVEEAKEEDPLISGNPFTSKEFINYAAGLSKGLAEEEEFDKGLARGAALAAEQRATGDLEQAKLDAEAEIERLKNLGFDVGDADKIAGREESLSENIRLFQKSQDNVQKIDEVIAILDAGGATGFEGLRNKLITQALTFVKGSSFKKWPQLDPRTRADAILKVLQQENIREILGESGRTISNLDREVIKEVFGNITVLTPEAVIKQKLQNSRKKTLMSANETKGKIKTDLGFFDRINQPSVVELDNKELIEQILAFDPDNQNIGTQVSGPQENVDLRNQNLLGGS